MEAGFPVCYTSEVLSIESWEEIVWFLFLSGEKETLGLKAERVKTAPYWRKSSNSTQGRQKLWLNKSVWVSLGGGGSWSPKEGKYTLPGQRDGMAAGEGKRWVTGWGSPVWLEKKEQEMRVWRWEILTGIICAWWSKEMGQGCSCETLQNLSMATGSSHLNAPFLSYSILKAFTKSSAW